MPTTTLPRSSRAEIRNPLLALPAVRKILALPPSVREPVAELLYDLQRDARAKAEKCWGTGKAPMAVYWRAVAVYSGHLARVLRRGT